MSHSPIGPGLGPVRCVAAVGRVCINALLAKAHEEGTPGAPSTGEGFEEPDFPELPVAKDSDEELEEFFESLDHRRSEWHGHAGMRRKLFRVSLRGGSSQQRRIGKFFDCWQRAGHHGWDSTGW